jgi:ADP-ribose pyrophosphatase
MANAVAIIAMQGSLVLLVRNRKRNGSIELPGGAMLPVESVHDAAVRELRQECGLTADREHVYLVGFRRTGPWDVYLAQVLRWSGKLQAGDDAEAAFWGDFYCLCEASFREDYDTVLRLYDWQRSQKSADG